LVKVGVPQSLVDIFENKLTEVMSLPLPEEEKGYLCLGAFDKINENIEKIDVVALGPGASINDSAKKLNLRVIEEIDKILVVDADGINALIDNLEVLNKRRAKNLILTPHLGEFSRLTGLSVGEIKKNRKKLAKDFALRYNLTLVLKGWRTLVTDGRQFFENNTGNPGMATAGSGDVLTGIIAGLAAQGIDCFTAAKTGAYLHGLAGDYAAKDKTQVCLIASDIIDYLPKVVKRG
jgi:NAD(P)H-hydrate epimerase